MSADVAMPILIVDDYKTMLRIIRNLLKQLGFEEVDEASDGSEALAKMRERKYGLIISDWNMPNCSGLDLLKRVRADGRLGKTPMMLVTAEKEKDQIIEAIKRVEAGLPVPELCRELGISSASFYKWRSKFGGMDTSMMARMKELEEENRRLRKMYVEEKLKAEIATEYLAKK